MCVSHMLSQRHELFHSVRATLSTVAGTKVFSQSGGHGSQPLCPPLSGVGKLGAIIDWVIGHKVPACLATVCPLIVHNMAAMHD